ncbi:related to ferric-chelate reductase [Fusarium mangiferae]|uniref:ferric-chelate reductase (NADPH) n=1 Tax=Fusarium mangiferae TaxID=192010 RepID=A0A1L7UG60_FUSMA|nr:uncharacterized protein FMAN_11837 [Fusarium mangiferae]CVL06717.1 related to ferric-chelate reductase [Fusarium mangiferae]
MSSIAPDAPASGSAAAPTQSSPPPPTQAQLMAIFAARAKNDHDAMILYAAVLAALIGLFTIVHIFVYLWRKSSLAQVSATVPPPFNYSESIKRLLLRKVPGAPSLGHALLYITYLGLNVGLVFVYTDDSILPLHVIVAARTGWLAIANLCLTVFLSLKITPLGFLVGWTYERLNPFHRVSGLMTFILVLVHAASYSSFFLEQQNAARLRVLDEIFGIVAGFTLFTVVAVALTLQRRRYELFYVLHVLFFIASLVFICLHHPTAAERVIIPISVAAGIWFFDRLARASRLVYHGVNNSATLQPLASGGTRVIMRKNLSGARSGQHAFLWIPGVRLFESHPFTIVNTQPLEFLIEARDGFTRDLHDYAVKNSGVTLKASVEGPYGQIPEPALYDKILIFAGGSGATFGIGIALQLLKDLGNIIKRDITVVWVMRNPDLLEWFSFHIEHLARAQGFKVLIHITDQIELSKIVFSDQAAPATRDSPEGTLVSEGQLGTTLTDDTPSQSDAQRGFMYATPIHFGRPQVDDIVAQTIEGMPASSRVLVLGCGPPSLLQDMRQSTTSRMTPNGAGISLQFEQFGW